MTFALWHGALSYGRLTSGNGQLWSWRDARDQQKYWNMLWHGIQAMIGWYEQSVPRNHSPHHYSTSASQNCWHEVGQAQGFMVLGQILALPYVWISRNQDLPKQAGFFHLFLSSNRNTHTSPVWPQQSCHSQNHWDHFSPILMVDVNKLHDFMQCAAATRLLDYITTWMSRCTGVPNKACHQYTEYVKSARDSRVLQHSVMSLCFELLMSGAFMTTAWSHITLHTRVTGTSAWVGGLEL